MSQRLIPVALVLVAAACASTAGAIDAAARLGFDPAAIVDLGSAAVVPRLDAKGTLTVLAIRERDGQWAASPITSARSPAGEDSLHLLSWGGATGEEWNTLVFGTAAPGTLRVELAGYPDQRGGTVARGAWVIALRARDVGPDALDWRFIDADGTVREGTGMFPPDA